jgi:hypothetical protein
MALSLQHLQQYDEGNAFLQKTTASDEMLYHYYRLELHRTSMQWKHSQLNVCKKFGAQASAGKVNLTLFFDHQESVLLQFKETGINAQWYAETVACVHITTKNNHLGNLDHKIILHDNACPHVVNTIKARVQHMSWEVLEHKGVQSSNFQISETGTQGMLISAGHSSETSCSQPLSAAAFGNLPKKHPSVGGTHF